MYVNIFGVTNEETPDITITLQLKTTLSDKKLKLPLPLKRKKTQFTCSS